MPPSSPAKNAVAKARKTYKGTRNSWLETGRRNLHSTIRFGQSTERNAFLRNLKGTNVMSTIKSTKRTPYENRPKRNYTFNKKSVENAVQYRKITNVWTPQTRGHTRLDAKSSKILANVYAAGAPNYNYQKMVNNVFARNNIMPRQKDVIADRLYELYGPNNNTASVEGANGTESNNDDEEELHSLAPQIKERVWTEPITMPVKTAKRSPALPVNWH